MDLLFVDDRGNMGFEVITAMELEKFYEEIHYKKTLLASLFGQETALSSWSRRWMSPGTTASSGLQRCPTVSS